MPQKAKPLLRAKLPRKVSQNRRVRKHHPRVRLLPTAKPTQRTIKTNLIKPALKRPAKMPRKPRIAVILLQSVSDI